MEKEENYIKKEKKKEGKREGERETAREREGGERERSLIYLIKKGESTNTQI